MIAYSIAIAKVTEPERWNEYAKRSRQLTNERGGRIVIRRGRQVAVEGEPLDGKVGIVAWPSFEEAVAHYQSPEYLAVRSYREGAGTLQRYIVEVDERLDTEVDAKSQSL